MRKYGKRYLGLLLAGSLLMGCGRGPGAVEQLTPESSVPQSTVEDAGNTADENGSSERQTEQEPVWDRENGSSYGALQQFSYELMLENMEVSNLVLSPVSAYLALGMIGMGADGETGQEFMEVMGSNMPAVSEILMSRYSQEQEGLELTIANSAWVDQQLTPKQQWLSDMQEIFRGESYRGELSSEAVMKQINSWCSEKTRGLVPVMLNEPLSADTRLALLNAIYFKGDWQNPFDAIDTAERPFTREDGTEVQVETMCKSEAQLQYIHSDLGEGVVLPYLGGDFAYVAILPPEGTQVRELYRQLTPEALAELLESENRELCDLRLPKYEISFDRKLNSSLAAMGLEQAFDGETADFSKLGDTEQNGTLYISLVQQKAVFRVDEEGTEAAAVTVVIANEAAALEIPEPRRLYFDRPFVYMILDLENQVPLFVGILDDPSLK
ncbi:MAG: serpin family protein [Lachnospiraceae bacterium]|nr:serpin family protein [Lachnospiraceae bacterium]